MSEERDVLITWRAIAAYFALAFAMMLPAFIPGQQLAGTDYVTGGFHFVEFATRRLRAGHLPLWVPYVFGGLPMYANPGSTYYPTRLLFSAILPAELIFPSVMLVQFALAGIGMHLFTRLLGVRPWVAGMAAVLFQLTGAVFSAVYAGHDGRIIGATLTPFVFFFVAKGVQTGRYRWFACLSAVTGLSMLSFQLQSVYYLLLSGGAWGVFLLVREWRAHGWPTVIRRGVLGIVAVGFSFVLAAIDILPFSQYVKDSPRSAVAKQDIAFSTQFSMPPTETLGLAVPEQAGIIERYHGPNPFKLHTEYVGAVVLLLLVLGALSFRRDTTWQFMAGQTLVALTICFGGYSAVYKLYYDYLPGTQKFRSPSIALFLVSFSLVTMAALTLNSLADEIELRATGGRRQPLPERLLNALIALGILDIVLAIGTVLDGNDRGLGWARFGVFFVIAAGLVKAWVHGRLSTRVAYLALGVLSVVDLWIIDRQFLWTQPPSEIVYAADDVVRFLESQPSGRVWAFPFPREPVTARYMGNGRFPTSSDYLMRFGIQQAGGEHGNQLYRWNRFVGLSPTGELDWHNFVDYPGILNASAIRYIVSGMPLRLIDGKKTRMGMIGLRELFHGKAYVYVNDSSASRTTLVDHVMPVASPELAMIAMRNGNWDGRTQAVIEAPASPLPAGRNVTGSPGIARITAEDPDHVSIHVEAARDAFLVLSDNDADGWHARVDGREAKIYRTNLTFRGVAVPAGAHEVSFEFRPVLAYWGLWISVVAWTALLASLVVAFIYRPVTGAYPSPAGASSARPARR
jgi:hypothetical protein